MVKKEYSWLPRPVTSYTDLNIHMYNHTRVELANQWHRVHAVSRGVSVPPVSAASSRQEKPQL